MNCLKAASLRPAVLPLTQTVGFNCASLFLPPPPPPNQMVSIRRMSGSRNPVEMTYYVQQHGVPLAGASAAKVLNTVDSQTMALTLGYFVQLQAERKHAAPHPPLSFDEWANRQKR